MTYKTKSCPHCGKTYAWMETGRHFGSPFRNCASCKNSFIDKDYIELACMPRGYGRQRKVTSFSITSPILGLIFIALGVYQTARGDSGGMDILFIAFGALFVLAADILSPKISQLIPNDVNSSTESFEILARDFRILSMPNLWSKLVFRFHRSFCKRSSRPILVSLIIGWNLPMV